MLRAGAVAGEGGGTIELIHRRIKGVMSLSQFRRHRIDIVEIG